MKLLPVICLALLIPFTSVAQDSAGSPAPIVFFDIAGTDFSGLREFYSSLSAWEIAEDGSFSTTIKNY
jgi:hypothetical protein